MIVCLCRGASESVINHAIDNGARSVRDLQRCGIGDQCGSCHNMLRKMLASAAADREAMWSAPAAPALSAAVNLPHEGR